MKKNVESIKWNRRLRAIKKACERMVNEGIAEKGITPTGEIGYKLADKTILTKN